MQADRIHIWHVGARGGYTPFDFPETLDPCFSITFFDEGRAKPTSVSVGSDGRSTGAEIRFLPALLWATQSALDFRQTTCPYGSGFKPLNPQFGQWYVFGNPDIDYVLGQACAPVAIQTVETTTLDSIPVSPDWPRPQVLVIDAQGAGYEIISGARELCSVSVDAVIVELELLPFFDKMPSISTVLPALLERGFYFARFVAEENPWASPFRTALGLRSKPFMGSADGVFLRDPRQIMSQSSPSRAVKYAILCLCLGFVDIASEVIKSIEKQSLVASDGLIDEIALDFASAVANTAALFPKAFGESREPSGYWSALRQTTTTPVEAFLHRWGFEVVAEEVRALRMKQLDLLAGG